MPIEGCLQEKRILSNTLVSYDSITKPFRDRDACCRKPGRPPRGKSFLFGHHQPFTLLDNNGCGNLLQILSEFLDAGKICAWYWGHERRSEFRTEWIHAARVAG
jgi:hypothetical protein